MTLDKAIVLAALTPEAINDDRRAKERRRDKAYKVSEAGRASQKRWRESERGRAAERRSKMSPHNLARRKQYARDQAAFLNSLKSVPCMDCGGVFDPVCMDFDHRPGEIKLYNVSAMKAGRPKLLAEIATCDVVCANCHRIRTFRQREHICVKKPEVIR